MEFEGNTSPTNAVIFSDSMSALQAMENEEIGPEMQRVKMLADKLLTSFPVRLVLQWIPGHTNIHGNDKADTLAKKGSHSTQPDKSASLKTAKNIIKHNYKEEWMNRWAMGSTGRQVFKHMNSVKSKDCLKQLERKDQTTIFRLRTQHVPLNSHLNRIIPEIPPNCLLCDHAYETVEHTLFHCPKLQDIRQIFLPLSPDIGNSLYGNTQQLKQTSAFFKLALSRRV